MLAALRSACLLLMLICSMRIFVSLLFGFVAACCCLSGGVCVCCLSGGVCVCCLSGGVYVCCLSGGVCVCGSYLCWYCVAV